MALLQVGLTRTEPATGGVGDLRARRVSPFRRVRLGLRVIVATLSSPGFVLGAGTTDAAVGGRAQQSGGISPVVVGEESGPLSATTVTPAAGVRYSSSRTVLTLRYHPRFLWRLPNPVSTARPLLLHQADLTASQVLSRRANLTLGIQEAYGEVDYSAVGFVFGAQSTNIDVEVLRVMRTSGNLGFDYMLTHRLSFGLGVEAEHNKPLGDAGPEGATFVESQGASATARLGYALTRTDAIGFSAGAGYYTSDLPSRFMSAISSIDWRHMFSKDASLTTGAGVGMIRDLDDDTATFYPVAGVEAEGSLQRRRDRTLRGFAGLRTTAYFDPILAELRPIVSVRAGVTDVMLKWTVGVEAFASTAATREPLEPPVDETTFGILVPVAYMLSRDSTLTFGARFGARAPHWADPHVKLTQFEAIGYVGIDWATGTAHVNSWVL